ncbi:DoxX family protein [Nocardia arthritidis]|uniref:DoxX family protein n=1 Tax=Nocardia arthritidis TaxID=228602 RepID=A0A6G9YM29_9NOCA|nr:DoxX family protein [Nocardia arthritidis]QIS14339.1 DoxX family protein [Nocardia arthritidis]
MAQAVAEEIREDMREMPEIATRTWHPVTRVLFRFVFVYLGIGLAAGWLAIALLKALHVPLRTVADVQDWWQLPALTNWFGSALFGIEKINYVGTGSGDTQVFWVSAFTWLVVAAVVAAVWSVLDRRRPAYPRLHEWFRLILRFALGLALVLYGTVKVMPSQMVFELQRLVEPFGDMSPMGALWSQTAASEPYEIALGVAELAAAALLFLPWTVTAGALLSFVATLQIFLLNLSFDVPVKLYSGQLVLLSLVLVAPQIGRITRVLLGRAVPAEPATPLFTGRLGKRIFAVGYTVLALFLIGDQVYQSWDAWHHYGSAQARSPLYGIWNVTEFTTAGQEMPALVDDNSPPHEYGDASLGPQRLRRIIFDAADGVTVQRMDESLVWFPATVDPDKQTVVFTGDVTGIFKIGTFRYERPEDGKLVLDGQISGRPVRMTLDQVDLNRYPLVARGFHWVQDVPYRR